MNGHVCNFASRYRQSLCSRSVTDDEQYCWQHRPANPWVRTAAADIELGDTVRPRELLDDRGIFVPSGPPSTVTEWWYLGEQRLSIQVRNMNSGSVTILHRNIGEHVWRRPR